MPAKQKLQQEDIERNRKEYTLSLKKKGTFLPRERVQVSCQLDVEESILDYRSVSTEHSRVSD
jgi:hypothetical protein